MNNLDKLDSFIDLALDHIDMEEEDLLRETWSEIYNFHKKNPTTLNLEDS